MVIINWVNIILRAIMELGIIVAFALWGYWIGNNSGQKLIFSIVLPILILLFWGFFDFRKIVSKPELFRLIQELFICGIAVIALNITGHRTLAIVMLAISIIHHILVYTLGQTLMKK